MSTKEEGVDMTIAMVAAVAATIAPGAKAPAFSLESSTGKKVALSDYQGQTLVLAFFPKAFTGG
jgi:peroxiredoxin Q/BCP